ncbi:cytochrome P450 family protein [Flindersiella endophytica]
MAHPTALPPGPSGPLLYLGWLSRRSPTSALERFARDYPRLAATRIGRHSVYLLNHPDLITELFVTNGRALRKGRSMEKIKLLLGDGLLTSEGELHARQRRLIQPAMHGDQLDAYRDLMTSAAGEVSAGWEEDTRVDIHREMSALTLTVVGHALFGRQLVRETAEVAACLDVLLSGFARHLLPGADFLLGLPTPTNRRRFAAVDRLDALVRRLVEEKQANPGNDLLSVLASRMDEKQARDEAMTLLLAGHETTANALAWTWLLLDQNPEVATWWHAEIDEKPLVYEGLPRTRAVLAEAMRLYPPAWILGRRLLRPIELDGWTLPAGALCVASQWAMHHDPRFWAKPGSFWPERWLTGGGEFDESAPGQPRGAYLPFGIGSRLCVGRGFAWLEGVLLLATLGRAWAPRLVAGHRIDVVPAITLRPKNGLPMTLSSR